MRSRARLHEPGGASRVALVASGDADLRSGVAAILAQEGLVVRAPSAPGELRAALDAARVDVAVLDDGAFEPWRSAGAGAPRVPVVLVTVREGAPDGGVAAELRMPFTAAELVAAVAGVLARGRTPDGEEGAW